MAQRNRLKVPDITLWLFGGVARLSGEARNSGAELRIAGVGPLVSLLLGGVFVGVTVLAASGAAGLVLSAFGWLGGINIAGLWFALIGWFLIGAATAESRQATVRGQTSPRLTYCRDCPNARKGGHWSYPVGNWWGLSRLPT